MEVHIVDLLYSSITHKYDTQMSERQPTDYCPEREYWLIGSLGHLSLIGPDPLLHHVHQTESRSAPSQTMLRNAVIHVR